jgi:hypothetical protein
MAAILFRAFRGAPSDLLKVFPVRVRPRLGSWYDKYLDAIYTGAMIVR